MAGIQCPNGDGGSCYPPSTALVIVKGTYSFVSQELLESLLPDLRPLVERKGGITLFEGTLPHEVIAAAGIMEPKLGLALHKFEEQSVRSYFGTGGSDPGGEIRRFEGSDGILYTCTCGHGPFKLSF